MIYITLEIQVPDPEGEGMDRLTLFRDLGRLGWTYVVLDESQ